MLKKRMMLDTHSVNVILLSLDYHQSQLEKLDLLDWRTRLILKYIDQARDQIYQSVGREYNHGSTMSSGLFADRFHQWWGKVKKLFRY